MKKKCKVVALPTEKESKIFCYTNSPFTSRNRYGYVNKFKKDVIAYGEEMPTTLVDCSPSFQVKETDGYFVNLYIISEDEIKVGDYTIYDSCEKDIIAKCIEIKKGSYPYIISYNGNENPVNSNQAKKVVATTDEQLGLPLIPEQFIKEYSEKGGISEVMCEVEQRDSVFVVTDTIINFKNK